MLAGRFLFLFTGGWGDHALFRAFRHGLYPFRILVRLLGNGWRIPADPFPFQEEFGGRHGPFPKVVHPLLIREVAVQFPFPCEHAEFLLDTGELLPVTERTVHIQVGVSLPGDILQVMISRLFAESARELALTKRSRFSAVGDMSKDAVGR